MSLRAMRSALLAAYPEGAAYQGGGAGRRLPLGQILCDLATPAGQAIAKASRSESARLRQERMRRKTLNWYGGLDAADYAAARTLAIDAARALAAKWEREERKAAAA